MSNVAVLASLLRQADEHGRLVRTQAELLPTLGQGGRQRVVTLNLFELHHYVADPAHRELVDSADRWTADGWPVVRALAVAGLPAERVTGSALSADLLRPARPGEPTRLAIFGSQDDVVEEYARRLSSAGRQLVHADTGQRDSWTADAASRALTGTRVDLVLVAVGTPHGVPTAARLQQAVECPVIAVGAGVGMAIGAERRAPAALQAAQLEWAWRLGSDPRRLWRRYGVDCLPLLPPLARAARQVGSTS